MLARLFPLSRAGHRLLLLLATASLPLPLLAQAGEYRIEVDGVDTARFTKDKTITLHLRVTDRAGNPAHDLPGVELIVEEDGKEVHREERQSGSKPEPIWTVLVLDRSGSMRDRGKMEALKKAAAHFVEMMPADVAEMAIISFSDHPSSAEPLTNSKPTLKREIFDLTPGGETGLYDAAYEGVETLIAARSPQDYRGRRAVVVLTDGKDTHSRRRDTDVIERARSAQVKVYMLGLGEKEDLNEGIMQKIADATGGRYFHAANADQLVSVFERVAREQASPRFSITFKSLRPFHDGTARGLVVRMRRLGGDGESVARDIAFVEAGYQTHGLITPSRDHGLYLGWLAILGLLIGIPLALRRLLRPG